MEKLCEARVDYDSLDGQPTMINPKTRTAFEAAALRQGTPSSDCFMASIKIACEPCQLGVTISAQAASIDTAMGKAAAEAYSRVADLKDFDCQYRSENQPGAVVTISENRVLVFVPLQQEQLS